MMVSPAPCAVTCEFEGRKDERVYRRREPLEKSAVLEIKLHCCYFTALLAAEKARFAEREAPESLSHL
jgi:hypothetical protein